MAMASVVLSDLLPEIMLCLPVKALVRFKCLHKSWRRLFESHEFVSTHQEQHEDNKYVLLRITHEPSKSKFISLSSDDNENIDEINFPFKKNSWLLAGHCNGIICLHKQVRIYSELIVLWNPLIREFKILPKPFNRILRCNSSGIGFGYDPKSYTYKLVRLITVRSTFFSYPKAEVYSLTTDLWREIDTSTLRNHELKEVYGGTYSHGFYYWLGIEKLEESRFEKNLVLAFDMSTELFQYISMPDCCNPPYTNGPWIKIEVWKDKKSIALFINLNDRPRNCIDIWVMDHPLGGVKVIWKKQMTVTLFPGLICRPMLFWKNDELLFKSSKGSVMSYNLVTHQTRDIPIPGVPRVDFCLSLNYVKNLTSVKRMK